MLVARSAFLHWHVPLAAIRAAHETRNPLSALAASLARIAIHHDGGMLLVSPRDKRAFMHLMRRVAPNLATEPAAATGDSNRRARRVIVGVVALQASVALAIGVGIYVESRPPQVMVTSEGVSRGGLR